MAKLNLQVFKRGKPIYWVIGGVALFVIFYLAFSKPASAGGSSGGAIVTGPSEALQAAQMQYGAQIQGAQIAAGVEAARIQAENNAASLGASVALANLATQEKVALFQLAREADLAAINAQTNLLINEQNISYGVETARLAAETQIGLRALDVSLLNKQMETNAAMFETQSKNLITQSVIAQVPSLKKRDRDDALAGIGGYTPVPGGAGGGGNIVEGAMGLVPNLIKLF